MNITSLRPNFIDYKGHTFLELDGTYFKGCRRCGGTGHYSFNGYDSICYSCSNTAAKLGDELGNDIQIAHKWIDGKIKAQAARDAKREQVRLAKIAKRDAAWQALKDQHPDVWELLSGVLQVSVPFESGELIIEPEYTERDIFVCSLASKLWDLDERPLTERQIAAVQRVADSRAAKATEAASHPAPAGRVVVTGEIVSTKVVEGDYGTAYKILVKADEGYKVWVSLPKQQADEAYDAWLAAIDGNGHSVIDFGYAVWFSGTNDSEDYKGIKGRRITFTATLEPSRDDVSFAFGKRPTKGAWL